MCKLATKIHALYICVYLHLYAIHIHIIFDSIKLTNTHGTTVSTCPNSIRHLSIRGRAFCAFVFFYYVHVKPTQKHKQYLRNLNYIYI